MDPASTLVGVAEISLALAGFAAIVLVLTERGAPLKPEQAANVRVMVLNAVASAFFCLGGVAVIALEGSTPLAWRFLSAVGLVALLAGSVLNYFLFIRHLEAPDPRLAAIWWSFAFAAGAIQVVNVLGILGPPSFGLLFLGLVVQLGQAGAQFVHLVFILLGRSPL